MRRRATCTTLDPLRKTLHAVLWESESLVYNRRELQDPVLYHPVPRLSRGADVDHCGTSVARTTAHV